MTPYQQLAKKRLARRFSNGDGVLLTSGSAQGEKGHILAVGTHENDTPQYTIALTSKDGVVSAKEGDFDSCPAANIGKYGGPSRGGARERGNNYGYRARH